MIKVETDCLSMNCFCDNCKNNKKYLKQFSVNGNLFNLCKECREILIEILK